MQNIIADIASIATIILFIFYFVGRLIIIKKEKNDVFERVDIYITNTNKIFNKYKIVEEVILNENSVEYMVITPIEKMYNWIKIYKYMDDGLCNKDRIYFKENLYKEHSIKIKVSMAETIPKYLIEFERSDYMIGEMLVAYNGKNGIQEEMIKCRHTFKSILYYILK